MTARRLRLWRAAPTLGERDPCGGRGGEQSRIRGGGTPSHTPAPTPRGAHRCQVSLQGQGHQHKDIGCCEEEEEGVGWRWLKEGGGWSRGGGGVRGGHSPMMRQGEGQL